MRLINSHPSSSLFIWWSALCIICLAYFIFYYYLFVNLALFKYSKRTILRYTFIFNCLKCFHECKMNQVLPNQIMHVKLWTRLLNHFLKIWICQTILEWLNIKHELIITPEINLNLFPIGGNTYRWVHKISPYVDPFKSDALINAIDNKEDLSLGHDDTAPHDIILRILSTILPRVGGTF